MEIARQTESTFLRLLRGGIGWVLAGLVLLPVEVEWVAVIVFGGIAVCWYGMDRKQRLYRGGGAVLFFLVLWLGWGVLATLFSGEVGGSAWSAVRIAALAMGGMACGLWVTEKGVLKWILGGGLALVGVVVYCFVRFSYWSKAASPPFFQDTNLLSAALVLLLPLLAWGVVTWKMNWKGIVALVCIAFLLVAIVVFRSRGAWLSMIAQVLVLPLFVLKRPRFRWLWFGLVLLTVGGYFIVRTTQSSTAPTTTDTLSQLQSIGELEQDFSNRERLMRWEVAWRMVMDKPVFGHGPGQFPSSFRLYLRGWEEGDRISYWFGWRLGAHSDSLTTLAETGFVGAIGFVFMLFAVSIVAFRRISDVGVGFGWEAALMLGLVSWVVHGVFNDLLSHSCLVVWAFAMMGSGLRNAEHSRKQ